MDASKKLAFGLVLPLFVAGCTSDTDTTGDTDTTPDTDTAADPDTADDTDTDTDTDTEAPVCGDDLIAPGQLCFDPAVNVDVGDTIDVGGAIDLVTIGTIDGINPDIVYAETTGGGRLGYVAGNGLGAFGSAVLLDDELGFVAGLQIADMDEDGNNDIVTTNDVFFGDGEGDAIRRGYSNGTEGIVSGLHVANIPGTSSFPDLVVAALGSSSLLQNNGGGDSEFNTEFIVLPDALDGAIAQVSANEAAAAMLLELSEGSAPLRLIPVFGVEGELSTGTAVNATLEAVGEDIAVGDLDGDGVEDMAVLVAGDKVNVLFYDEGSFADQGGNDYVSYDVGAGASAIAVGDVDGDGNLDVLVANEADDSVSVLLGDGTGALTAQTLELASGAAPRAMALADVNADGVDDIVLATAAPEDITVLVSNP